MTFYDRSTPPGPPSPPSEDDIRRLVHDFYGRVRSDDLLGPVFEEHIREWDAHLERMCDFWSGVLRASGRYLGNPIRAHAAVPGLETRHFGRWLALFRQSAEATLEPTAARDVLRRAERMSRVLLRNRPEGAPERSGTGSPGTERPASRPSSSLARVP